MGKVKKCSSCGATGKNYFNKNFDLSWTQDTRLFTEELKVKLKYIENNRLQGKNHYVKSRKHVGSVVIENEPKYEAFDYPDSNYRLLSLFKYWNIVEYFFPYKYMTDQNWNDVLVEMIPKFKNAQNITDYHLAMLETVCKINDSHASTFNTKWTLGFLTGGSKNAPVKLTMANDSIFVTGFYNDSLAQINDFELGDAILKLKGEPINTVIERIMKYTPASNQKQKVRRIENALLRGNTDSIRITFGKNGNLKERYIQRYLYKEFDYQIPVVEKCKILEGDIPYVIVQNIEGSEVDGILDTLMNYRAIIFDIRGYPKNIFRRISRRLNPAPQQFVNIIRPDLSYPGKFYWDEKKTTGIVNKSPYTGKVILLVDNTTKSRAEYMVMSLQTAPNVTTIGGQTAGADGTFSNIEFVGGFRTGMSGTGIFYPDGSETQRTGIRIDINAQPTIESAINGKDYILEKAIDFIHDGL